VLGAFLWTAGLFVAAFVLLTAVMLANPSSPRVIHGVAHTYAVVLAMLALVCMAAGFSLVRRGVSPINQLRERLTAVHAGQDRRVEGAYPTEVQPLVDDLNGLLDHQDRMVRRAVAKAGDLAHGLKTPLAVLAQEAERAKSDGHRELAATLGQQVERMRRQIDYHLAHARAAASGAMPGARCSVLESAEGLSRTLQRLHAARGVDIRLAIPPEHAVRCQREDLDEMLGNLLDNACKWAQSTVVVSSTEMGGDIVVAIDDDGPGLAASLRDVVLQRGVRADEASPGSGFGLSIVRDLAELYRGSIVLTESPAGGLRARLQLPRPPTA
jgi:signal transduction histidine kinase